METELHDRWHEFEQDHEGYATRMYNQDGFGIRSERSTITRVIGFDYAGEVRTYRDML